MSINTPIHTNQYSIDRVLQAGLPVILVFWQKEAPAWPQLESRLAELARSHAGQLLIAQIDIAAEKDLRQRYRIDKAPTLIFVREGKEVAREEGAPDDARLNAWVKHLLHGGPRPAPRSAGREAAPQTSPGRSSSSPAPDRPITLSDATFDQTLRSPLPVLVDFWAPWCGPCHMIAPTIEELARENQGRLLVGKLNVDENPATARRYGVMSIPTLILFKNGKVVDRVTGALPAHLLRQRVQAHLR